jgi:hypothetical protein
MNRLDNENLNDTQENFYHTLTPFTTQSQYGEHSCAPSIGYISERSNISTCPIHHHIINYPSDTFPLKTKDNFKFVLSSQTNGTSCHSHHHGTCQRHHKPKRITTPIINESMNSLFDFISKQKDKYIYFIFLDDQQQDLCDRSFSSSSAGGGGHYCTHSSNDSTRQLINPIPHQQTNDNFKHSAPSSTGSSSHSSSGIGSSIESPYNHWKYLTPLTVTTTTTDPNNFLSDNKSSKEQSLTNKIIEPISISST